MDPASAILPAGLSLGIDGHTLTIDPTNPAFDYLALGEPLEIVVSYDVEDAQGATVAQTATITITGTNDAPVISTASIQMTSGPGGQVTFSGISVSDPDVGDTFTYDAASVSEHSVTGSGSGTLSRDQCDVEYRHSL